MRLTIGRVFGALAKVVYRDEIRDALSGVILQGLSAWASNGSALLRLDLPEAVERTTILRGKDVEKAMARLPKRNGEAHLTLGETTQIEVKRGDQVEHHAVKVVDAVPPDHTYLWPTDAPKASVTLDARLLQPMLDAVIALHEGYSDARFSLHVYSDTRAVVIATERDGCYLDGMIMPLYLRDRDDTLKHIAPYGTRQRAVSEAA